MIIDGNLGRLECFIVLGNTPMLMGRPLLAALQVRVDYSNNSMCLGGDLWRLLSLGPRGEHLLRLDDGDYATLDRESEYTFDRVTTDTDGISRQRGPEADTIDLRTYLAETQAKDVPSEVERTLQAADVEILDEPNAEQPTEDFVDTDPDAVVRKEVTQKILRQLQEHQRLLSRRTDQKAEGMLVAYDRNRLYFWELYSGDARLAEAMNRAGYYVRTFDTLNGWDFSLRRYRESFLREFYECLLDVVWMAPPCISWSTMQNINLINQRNEE